MRFSNSIFRWATARCGVVLLLVLMSGWSGAQTPPDPTAALLQSQPQIDTLSPVTATASFDPPVVRPGGAATYRVTFNAMMDSIRWPEDVVAPRQLEQEPGGRGQMFVPAGGALQPRTSFNTRIRATSEGHFTVPRFMVYVYGKPVTVPAATLEVTSDPAVAIPAAPELRLELSATNVFVNQPVTARLMLPGNASGNVQVITQAKLLGEGFITDTGQVRQRVEMMPIGNGSVPTYLYEVDITPIAPGALSISGQGFTAGNQFSGAITITGHAIIAGRPPQYLLVDSTPVTLNVRPVPDQGRLPGYSGAIGRFKLDAATLSTNVVQAGDPLAYSVRVLGEGNLARLVPPAPPEVAGWKVYAGQPDPGPPQLIQARGFIQFNYTLVPLSEKSQVTPAIPFSYFDPATESFVSLNLPTLPVTVQPSAIPVNVDDLAEASQVPDDREPELKLSGLAPRPGRTMNSLTPWQLSRWFPLVQAAPLVFFAGLWWWDRRRRFYEAHPEIILRRRARRALHREWAALQKAASLGDTSRFADCAVNAMRVACAPHYPAEPRALVSTDVLPLLPQNDAAGRNAVCAVFEAVNAGRFAATTPEANELLALRAEVNRVLVQLEEQLR